MPLPAGGWRASLTGELMEECLNRCRGFLCGALAVFAIALATAGCAHVADSSYMMKMSDESSRRGAEAFASGDRELALERFREALRIDRSIDNHDGEMLDLINLGRVYTSLGRYAEATDFLNGAVTLGVKTRDYALLSDAHAAFARAEYLAGHSGTALDNIEDALQIDSGLGLRSGSKLNLKGLIYIEAGRHAEAAAIINEALEINSSNNDTLETANSYRALGDLNSSRGLFADALGFYEKAYRIDHPSGDSHKIAGDLARMAELHLALGERTKAAVLFERSYVVSFNSGQRDNAVGVLDKMIDVYTGLGETGKAVFYQKVKDGLSAGK